MAVSTASASSPRCAFNLRRAIVPGFGGHTLLLLPASETLQRLVADGAEKIGADSRARRIEAAVRPQQRQKAFLYDILGIGHRAGEPPRKAEKRKVVLVEEPQERRFPALAGVADQSLGGFSHV
ncbi:MAG TPA: hypothetical protein VGH38_11590 [Bryobacteraceae bacterium]